MGRYASDTTVSAERSIDEIRSTLRKYGADAFTYGERSLPPAAFLEFEMQDRRVRFVISLPELRSFRLTETGRERTAQSARTEWEKAIRQRWRALALIVKAKLVAVEDGVVEFEQEFALHFVMADGQTVYEHLRPMLPEICNVQQLPQLMPGA